jgi:hypothetical protein
MRTCDVMVAAHNIMVAACDVVAADVAVTSSNGDLIGSQLGGTNEEPVWYLSSFFTALVR